METHALEILGAFIYKYDRFEDQRGSFQEIFSTVKPYGHFTGMERQLNLSFSAKNVVRGIHCAPHAKLCTCVRGRLFDVVVDLRPKSETYLRWHGEWLTPENCLQLFVPAGCGHGFFAAENDTMLVYYQDGVYNPLLDKLVHWQDPRIGIEWPEAPEYILSEKDRFAPLLEMIL